MDDNGRFGFDPEDLDRVIRDASEGLRDAFEGVSRFFTVPGDRAGWSSLFEDLARRPRTRPETTGEAGDGVWAIYTVSADGGARVEEVYATELDALARTGTTPTRLAKSDSCRTVLPSASWTIQTRQRRPLVAPSGG